MITDEASLHMIKINNIWQSKLENAKLNKYASDKRGFYQM